MMKNSKSVKWKLDEEYMEEERFESINAFKQLFNNKKSINYISSTSPTLLNSESDSDSSISWNKLEKLWFSSLPSISKKEKLFHSESIFAKINNIHKPAIRSATTTVTATTTTTTDKTMVDNDEENKQIQLDKSLVKPEFNTENIEEEEEEEEQTIAISENSTSRDNSEFSFTGNSLDDFKIRIIDKSDINPIVYNKQLMKKKSFHDLLNISIKK